MFDPHLTHFNIHPIPLAQPHKSHVVSDCRTSTWVVVLSLCPRDMTSQRADLQRCMLWQTDRFSQKQEKEKKNLIIDHFCRVQWPQTHYCLITLIVGVLHYMVFIDVQMVFSKSVPFRDEHLIFSILKGGFVVRKFSKSSLLNNNNPIDLGHEIPPSISQYSAVSLSSPAEWYFSLKTSRRDDDRSSPEREARSLVQWLLFRACNFP